MAAIIGAIPLVVLPVVLTRGFGLFTPNRSRAGLTSATGDRTQSCARLIDGNPSFTSVAFSKDGLYLVAGDASGRVYLRNLATRQIVYAPRDPASQGIRAVAFNPDGQFAAADANGHVYLYGHRLLATFRIVGVTSVAFSEDGRYLAASESNGQLLLCHTR